MSEHLIYRSARIQITRKLARFGDSSYPIASIGGVHMRRMSRLPYICGGLIFVVIAWICAAHAEKGLALFCSFVGIMGLINAFKPHQLILRTGSGDQVAFKSRRLKSVSEVKDAIESAVSHQVG